MITVAVQKVTPVVLAQLESDVQKISNPTCPIAAQATQQVAVRVQQEFEDGYVQVARREAEKITPDFHARLAAIQAEEETRLRTAYQQAQTNIQPVSSLSASWVGSAVTSTFALSGSTPMLASLETHSHSFADDIVRGSTMLTVSVTSTPFPNSPSGGCVSPTKVAWSFDASGACKENALVTPLSSANLNASTQ